MSAPLKIISRKIASLTSVCTASSFQYQLVAIIVNEMEIAQQNSNGENESESCTTTDELTESSENLFLRNISEIIANSERNSMSTDGCGPLLIEEVKSIVQPQFGYFLPLALTPRMRSKRLSYLT